MSRSIETLRSAWISYLRVSTAEQADRELSISAQRRAAQEHAARHGASILREYVEAGASGMNSHRRYSGKCSRIPFGRIATLQ